MNKNLSRPRQVKLRQSFATFYYSRKTDLICLKLLYSILLKKKVFVITWKINKFLYFWEKIKC